MAKQVRHAPEPELDDLTAVDGPDLKNLSIPACLNLAMRLLPSPAGILNGALLPLYSGEARFAQASLQRLDPAGLSDLHRGGFELHAGLTLLCIDQFEAALAHLETAHRIHTTTNNGLACLMANVLAGNSHRASWLASSLAETSEQPERQQFIGHLCALLYPGDPALESHREAQRTKLRQAIDRLFDC